MAQTFSVGAIEIRPDERLVLQHGQPVALGTRAFDVLMCLIANRDRVVSKRELMETVWPESVVEEGNLSVHVYALRKLLGARALATVPGRGYRFVLPLIEGAGVGESTPNGSPDRASAAAAGDAAPALPSTPSIAVLPFDNLGRDPGQESFIDGVVEDVITELSRFRSLFVVARNSTFSYKGKASDVRTVARDLGVRYVVEGSFRRDNDRIRVTAQLVDAVRGAHVWAERYDRSVDDVFSVQEELTRAIAAAIAPQIEAFEFQQLRSLRPSNLGAYELAMRARDVARRADRQAAAASHEEALALAEQAVGIDPHSVAALGTIAYLRWRELWARAQPLPAQAHDAVLEAGLDAARRALALDGNDHAAHLWNGMLLIFARRHEAGLAALRRAHELNPNDALALSLLGQYEAMGGDPLAGVRHAADALRLSPRDSMRWSFLNSLAWSQFAAGDFAAAAQTAQRSIDEAPRFYPPQLCLIVSHVALGDVEAARAAYAALQALAPETVDARLAGDWPFADQKLTQRLTEHLRLAAGSAVPTARPPRQSRPAAR